MSKDRFLRDPLGSTLESVPAEWIREGWSIERFRDDVVYELARSLSKTGGFALAAELWFQTLPVVLTMPEVVNLYERLRDEGERLEMEWRQSFLAAFPEAEAALPESRDREALSSAIIDAVVTGDGRSLDWVLEAYQEFPGAVSDLVAFAEQAEHRGHTLIAALIRESVKRQA